MVYHSDHPLNNERDEWTRRMNTVLYCSFNGIVYETRAYTKADIDQLVSNHGLVCLTSADRQFDFWFAPSTAGCQRHTNTIATELLLATSSFTAKTVPLLPGCVVIATHDADGDLDGLSWQQLDLLAAKEPLADQSCCPCPRSSHRSCGTPSAARDHRRTRHPAGKEARSRRRLSFTPRCSGAASLRHACPHDVPPSPLLARR